jgi:elongation factor P
MKPAKLANGTEIQVADFIAIDEWIDIDTRDNSFKGRSKK